MDRLVALPVSGDSFLLQRGSTNILVDGGHSSQALISALSTATLAIRHLHIVVCTHADKDHAGGLVDILDKSRIHVDEFWLPGAWADSLPDLLQDPRLVVDTLVAEFNESEFGAANDPEQDDDRFEARVHARISAARRDVKGGRRESSIRAEQDPQGNDAGLVWLRRQASNVELDEANDEEAARAFGRGRRLIRYRASKRRMTRQWSAFWIGLIDTAERIRKIAVQAIRHGSRVRWFDFDEYGKTRNASGGVKGLLEPLNAVELLVPPPPITALTYMLRLTPANEECLVFFSPAAERWPDGLGVVFTGDSPLGDGPGYSRTLLDRKWPAGSTGLVVATAPHHGSESNAAAYAHLSQWASVLLWLRSGGSAKHPGPTFRKLPEALRACTHCPHQKLEREMAVVQLSPSPWWPIFRVNAHECSC